MERGFSRVGRRNWVVLLLFASILGNAARLHAERKPRPGRPPKVGVKVRQRTLDCSHFVNYVYQRAHLPYRYASSEELYEGVDAFRRVFDPRPGDLIVWRGHVGIITDPNENKFVSVLRSGVKSDNYRSRYWKTRGRPRFLRYASVQTAEMVARYLSPEASTEGD